MVRRGRLQPVDDLLIRQSLAGEQRRDAGADAYEQQARAALAPAGSVPTEAASTATTREELAAVADIQTQYETVIDDLSALEPPEAVAEAHDQAIAAFESLSSAYAAVGDAAEADDQQALEARTKELQSAGTEFQTQFNSAQQKFDAEGITFDVPSGG